MASYRKIIHVDMDAFFASVEQRDNPKLRGKPVVVGGSPDKRGAIAAASYEARKYGIHSAMPSRQAAKLCPHLIFVRPQMGKYRDISQQIREIFLSYTPLVEPVAFDEAYLDVTEPITDHPSAMAIAREIKQRIRQETQLTASAGLSVNKFLAKMATGINKPDGLSLIRPEEGAAFVQKLPIEKFHGIGKATTKKMHQLNIKTGADLYEWSEEKLIQQFGKVGRYFFQIARGNDSRIVNPNRVRKSVGAERSFDPDIRDRNQCLEQLQNIAENVHHRLLKANKQGKTLTLKVKYANYQQITRSRTIEQHYDTLQKISLTAQELFQQHVEQHPIRLLGISIGGLNSNQSSPIKQLSLFPDI